MTEREKQVTNGAMEAVNILLETRGPRCGVQLKDDALVLTPDEIKKLEESGVLRPVSEAEWSRFVLRALISYHERITMGEYPSLDCWKRGLEFAVSCVEEKIKK